MKNQCKAETVCLQTSKEQMETEIKELCHKNMKIYYNLAKDVQDVYTENYKTVQRNIKEYLNKWRIYHIHGSEYLTLTQVSILK